MFNMSNTKYISQNDARHFGTMFSAIAENKKGQTRAFRRILESLKFEKGEIDFKFEFFEIGYPDYYGEVCSDNYYRDIETFQNHLVAWALSQKEHLDTIGVQVTLEYENVHTFHHGEVFLPVFKYKLPVLQEVLDASSEQKEKYANDLVEVCWIFRHGIVTPLNDATVPLDEAIERLAILIKQRGM